MRAAVLYENNQIKAEDIAETPCGADEVRVEVKAAGICGSDIHKMQTRWKYPLPAVMGHEFAGEITETGSNVKSVKVGDRVAGIPFEPCGECMYCKSGEYSLCDNYKMIGSHFHGAFAENVVLKEANVIPIRDLDYEEGAMIEPLAVSMHGVLGIEPRIGDRVAVFGVGTIGILVIECLKLAGVKEIVAIDIKPEKLQEAADFGCSHTINGAEEDVYARLMEITDGAGVDIAMECAGSPITQEQCLLVTKKKGKIGFLGIAYRDLLLHEQAIENIFRREITLKGFWNSYSAPFPGEAWQKAIEFVEQGQIKLKPLISHRYAIEETKEAFDMVLSRTENYNKVMILPEKGVH